MFRIVLLSGIALLSTAPLVHASKGSILPRSFVSFTSFGTDAHVADLRVIGEQPCMLLGTGFRVGGRNELRVACGHHASSGMMISTPVAVDHASAFDVTPTYLDVVGQAAAGKALLVRHWFQPQPGPGYGFGGAARLDGISVAGQSNVALVDVDSLADGSTIVLGDATTTRGVDGVFAGFVAKVTATGDLDPAFGSAGVVQLVVPGRTRVFPRAMRVMDDSRIFVVGSASSKLSGAFEPFAALLEPSGAPVAGFGVDGIARPSFGVRGSIELSSLAESAAAGTFPIHVGGSLNSQGETRVFVTKLGSNGGQTGWGGPRSTKVVTTLGGPDHRQIMDIELLRDGSVIGAAELLVNGEFDSFVTRFRPSNGAPDTSFSTGGIEAIDTHPGTRDDEWSSAIMVDPNGSAWIAGGARVGRTTSVHLYRALQTGSARTAKRSDAFVFASSATGAILSCGTTARTACTVRRGKATSIVATTTRKPASSSPLLKPYLRIWSKAPGSRTWTMTERRGPSLVVGADVALVTSLRLGAGQHEISVHRNGFTTVGAAWSDPLHVKVG